MGWKLFRSGRSPGFRGGKKKFIFAWTLTSGILQIEIAIGIEIERDNV